MRSTHWLIAKAARAAPHRRRAAAAARAVQAHRARAPARLAARRSRRSAARRGSPPRRWPATARCACRRRRSAALASAAVASAVARARRRAASARCRCSACAAAARPRRPATAPALPRVSDRPREQAGEQALPAADVEHARVRRHSAALEQAAEHRVAAELAAREVPGEAAGRGGTARRRCGAVRAMRLRRTTASRLRLGTRAAHGGDSSRAHGIRCASGQRLRQRHRAAGRPRGNARAAAAARRARPGGPPRCARAWPSCSSRMSPPARLVRQARQHALGSRSRVSKPRRVQLTRRRPEPVQHRVEERIAQARRCAEEARALAGQLGEQLLRAPDLAREAARPEQREGVPVHEAVVLHARGRARRSRAPAPGACVRARRCRRRWRARRGGRAGRARAGVTCGSGPSSIVSAISPRAALAAGRRVMLGPSRLLRGHRPAAVSAAWFSATPASGPGPGLGHRERQPGGQPHAQPTLARSSGGIGQRRGAGWQRHRTCSEPRPSRAAIFPQARQRRSCRAAEQAHGARMRRPLGGP